MNRLFLDLETYCDILITDGSYRYAERSEFLLAGWAWNEEVVQIQESSTGLQELCDSADEVVIHHSMFDRIQLGAWRITLQVEKIFDTMACAYEHALPGSLDDLAAFFKIPGKSPEGKKLLRLFCKPRPKNQKLCRATKRTHPEEWERFREYCRQDVAVMRAVWHRLPKFNFSPFERALWCADQRMNDRGVYVDIPFVSGAVTAWNREQRKLAEEAVVLTDGILSATTQRDGTLAFLFDTYGVLLPDLTKETVQQTLSDPTLDPVVRALLENRVSYTQNTAAKYKRLQASVCPDGRLRGAFQFCGAQRTGRWAGRLFQAHNLARSSVKSPQIERYIAAVKAGVLDLLEEDVSSALKNSVRGCLIAAPGKKFVVGDLSNVEGRKAAWLAGEKWKLEAFWAFDAKKGPDLYIRSFAKAFGRDISSVTSSERQIGKVLELSMGFGGGVGAFVKMSANYGVDLSSLVKVPILPRIRAESEAFLAWLLSKGAPTHGLSAPVFVAVESLKRVWREANPRIVQYWGELESAARSALTHPGTWYSARTVEAVLKNGCLLLRLPSGRFLCYPQASRTGEGIRYYGPETYTRKWVRLATWGGKLFENITQACARDVFAVGFLRAEQQNYPTVMMVHDELVAETPDTSDYSTAGLIECMIEVPPWCKGLPLAAAGFETYRYQKDDS